MQNEWNPIIIIEEWEWATQTVFKWRKNLHNKSNRERVFQLSALIKMFSYINRPNGDRTPFRGGNVLGNWNQNTRERKTWHGKCQSPHERVGNYLFLAIEFLSACLASHGDNFSILSIGCSIDSGNIWIIQNVLSNSVLLCFCFSPVPPPVSVSAVASFGIFRA